MSTRRIMDLTNFVQSPNAYGSKILVAVGDSLTMSEQEAAYHEVTGRPMPSIPNFLAQITITTNRHVKAL
jgi:UDP-2,3-diacylglucosamine pyrophosphatase LpxH